ncbi:integrase arm-type DNA-binding domain-containing protein [Parasphingorhabdus sp.]
MKYPYLGKEKKLSLGRYPDVSLKVARERREAAAKTFSSIAKDYITKIEKEGRAAVTIKKTRWLLPLLKARKLIGQRVSLEGMRAGFDLLYIERIKCLERK